ncbi:hypothetical protein [Kitasatospora sp. NBC_01302]|uniref:hypothetical protein n=1 Tax=Kitasatospora sp. NBC_01302 TaxID=2903575 RepID=UPI002E10C210|nr:hypothetical protein OG294_35510 [Kitasatospora sp. NBC_01302]
MNATKYLTTPLAAVTLGAALALSAVAPAAVAAPAAVPGALHAAPQGVTDEVVLTNDSNGQTVRVAVGDRIDVRLTGSTAGEAALAWTEPTAGDSAVLQRTAGGTAPDGSAWAAFTAQGGGSGQITAERRCVPTPGVVCSHVVVRWKVTVVVG